MITVLVGDMFETPMQTLVNTVNCVGIMGKGIAKTFRDRFPNMFEDYKRRCASKQVQPGVPYYYHDMLGSSVLNFPTKGHWRSSSKVADIVRGLDLFIENYQEWGITSIAFPPLGCGNGGLDWDLVGPLMYQKLAPLDINIEIYAPFGISRKQLTKEFLQKPVELNFSEKGKKPETFNPEWLALIEVLHQLQRQPYANPIGRTIFQKICYIMTELGVETGFTFKQGSYGPFSHDVKSAIRYFANSNLIQEKQLGKMTALHVDKAYENYSAKYSSTIKARKEPIRKTVDLFTRIKNSDQAEEVTTVLFASRKIKTEKEQVTEQELFDYILAWKKSWNEESKRNSIASTIRNLEMLDWLKLSYSESLPDQIH